MEQRVGHRIFLLSPAYAGGERAQMILRDQAQFPLARSLRGKRGAPIADVFTFLSGLYFRGKIAYANAFARPARGTSGVLVITPTRGLIDARTRIRLDDLREFGHIFGAVQLMPADFDNNRHVSALLEQAHRFREAEHQIEILHRLTCCTFAQIVSHAGDMDEAFGRRSDADSTGIVANNVLECRQLPGRQHLDQRLVGIGLLIEHLDFTALVLSGEFDVDTGHETAIHRK